MKGNVAEVQFFIPDTVIYHGGCYDGLTAAWLVWRSFPDAGINFLPATYSGELPIPEPRSRVLMVDFSYPREQMIELDDALDEFLVLDHHKTAREACEGLDFCEFDMARAGCQMTWDWLASMLDAMDRQDLQRRSRPWLVEHVADRDLWRLALPDTPAVHAYYTSVEMTFEAWEELHHTDFDVVLSGGRAIRRSIDRYCEKVGAERILISTTWGKAFLVNAPYLNASALAHWLVTSFEFSWAVAWFQRADRLFQYSLRSSDEGQDVSEIAKHYGGGGHHGAAGFESKMPPWELWRP